MDVFNISEYITIARKGLTSSNAQGPAGILLLSQIGDLLNPRVDFDDSKITNLVKHKKDVQIEIINAVSNPKIVIDVVSGFKSTVKRDFNTITIDNVCLRLITLINNDPNISSNNKKILNDSFEFDDSATFLAHALIHAVGRANTLDSKTTTTDEVPYLTEANNHCPICGSDLVKKSKGKNIPFYEITKIFDEVFDEDIKKDLETIYVAPRSLNDFSNKIALCLNCLNEYRLAPTKETYKLLYDKKRSFEENSKITNQLSGLDVEKELSIIIRGLGELSKDEVGVMTELDPKEIVEKIPDDVVLKDDVTRWVLQYYKYIEKQFSNLDTTGITRFSVIASQIKLAFEKLDALGTMTQKQIFNRLSLWVVDKIGYSIDNLNVVNIIIAFFVQNCEVFYEIS